MAAFKLTKNPLHLGLGATAVPLPDFTGEMSWYADYGQAHGSDGVEGRLVSMHTFTDDWDSWEMHPSGHEVVLCVGGEIILVQEIADDTGEKSTVETALTSGEGALNDPGVWHTARVSETATCVFITAGLGTEHRPL